MNRKSKRWRNIVERENKTEIVQVYGVFVGQVRERKREKEEKRKTESNK